MDLGAQVQLKNTNLIRKIAVGPGQVRGGLENQWWTWLKSTLKDFKSNWTLAKSNWTWSKSTSKSQVHL